jgi:hypothetical protein
MKKILLKFSVFMVAIFLSLLLVAPALIYADDITIFVIEGVTVPVTGGTPVSTITATTQYTGTVSWSPDHDPFAPGTAYTATITLTAIAPYDFTAVPENSFTVAGATATNAAGSGIITAVFPATDDSVITISAIPGVTAPVTGGAPVSAITETDEYTGTVTWAPIDDPFAASTVYTAEITLTPKTGYTLTGVPENFFTVAGATATNAADSGDVTAAFPATAAADSVITISAIPGVTVPVIGGTPVSTITETTQYTGTVSWAPADDPFAANTVYTATIILAPKTGYTLTGVAANFFTVIGATAINAADSGDVTAAFPATAAESLNITAIGSIIGTPQVGVELTAGALTPAGATATYQWQIADVIGGPYTDISGATTNKYTPVAADEGKFIRVVATGTGGDTGTATSDPTTTAVAAAAVIIPTVPLGTTSTFAILAGTGITDAGAASVISGDVGLSPTTGAGITGLTGAQVTGTIYVVDATGPAGSVINPSLLTTAKNDLIAAYDNTIGRTPTVTFSEATNPLGGKTLTSGVYKFNSRVTDLDGTLTLDAQGDPNAVFIFQATSSLITASASSVNLINGARFCRVFWVVPSSATLGSDSTFVGHIFALTSISVTSGTTVYGQLLARNGAVTLDHDTITNGPCDTVAPPAPAPPATTDTTAATDTTATTAVEDTTATAEAPVEQTVEGGQLPKTSTPWYNILLAGIVLTIMGSISWRVARKRINT